MKTLYPLNEFNQKELNEMKKCFCTTEKTYKRNEIIMQLDSENNSVAFLEAGTAHLVTTTFDGTRTIVDYFEPGNIFGKRFSPCTSIDPYIVVAKTKCKVLFADYQRLITCCSNCCEKHIRLIDAMILTMSKRAQMHVEILGKRSIQGKLMSFFYHVSVAKQSKSFTLPLSLSDLADYISVDRSAMMREIKKLNDENIIKSKANKITVVRDNFL